MAGRSRAGRPSSIPHRQGDLRRGCEGHRGDTKKVHGFTHESLELVGRRHDLTLIDDASGINTTRPLSSTRGGRRQIANRICKLALRARHHQLPRCGLTGTARRDSFAMTLRAGAHDVSVFRHPDPAIEQVKGARVVTAGDVLQTERRPVYEAVSSSRH